MRHLLTEQANIYSQFRNERKKEEANHNIKNVSLDSYVFISITWLESLLFLLVISNL